ncbi:MAG: hypothetical protein ACKV2V_03875 [Blastocatellia bacterium]
MVKLRVRKFLQSHGARGLVCAAACGADILALEAAVELGIRCRIALPFNRAAFRAMSVVDRGGDWGVRYDKLLDEIAHATDLVEATHDPEDAQTWFSGNRDILDQAAWLAGQLSTNVAALVVWNAVSHGDNDVTDHFRREAASRGYRVAEILTVP